MLSAFMLVPLFFTLPSFNIAPSDSGMPDYIDCMAPGDSLHDLASVIVFRQLASGGFAAPAETLDVRSREGDADTCWVEPTVAGAHIWVVAVDTVGNASCASNVVYIGPTTGVEDGQVNPTRGVRYEFWVDTLGRRVARPFASGIYWHVSVLDDGTKRVKKRVLIK